MTMQTLLHLLLDFSTIRRSQTETRNETWREALSE